MPKPEEIRHFTKEGNWGGGGKKCSQKKGATKKQSVSKTVTTLHTSCTRHQ